MAKTANTGFSYYRSLDANASDPLPTPILMANSITLRIGDAVRVNTSGLIVTAGVGNAVGGIVVGFVDNNGINVLGFGVNNTTGCTIVGDDTVTTSSSNSTRASAVFAQVILDVAGDILWLNKTDGALAQTNLFQMFDCDANSRQITTGGASDANGQFQLMVFDPESTGGAAADTTKGLFRINENQFGLAIDSATAKVAA